MEKFGVVFMFIQCFSSKILTRVFQPNVEDGKCLSVWGAELTSSEAEPFETPIPIALLSNLNTKYTFFWENFRFDWFIW
jgi:hypothetical protein